MTDLRVEYLFRFRPSNVMFLEFQVHYLKEFFLNASKYCGSVLKNDFVVVVVLVLGAELFSKFPQNWKIVLNLEKNMQYGWFIPD